MNDRFIPRDERLLEYATPSQREKLEAYWRHGSQRAAAKALGLRGQTSIANAFTAVRRRAARLGYSPDHGLKHGVPDGQKLKGVSSLYDATGNLRNQWVKTTEDRERQAELLREIVEGLRDEVPRAAAIEGPSTTNADLMAGYVVGDHHLSLYAWKEEAGGDYDQEKAERLLGGAFEALTAALPAAEQAVVAFLGDLFHYDGKLPVTPTAGNILDADGRYALMVRTGIRLVRRTIERARSKHKDVRVIVQAGNHDPSSALFLAESLAALYENEPRVTVDTSPSQFHYHEFGQTLIGVCHGHEVKLQQLPLIMATDRPNAWGRTRFRTWWSGHIHHDRVLDVQGTRVESFRVLPPTDAWAHGKGYRSSREMKALLFHAKYGEVQRVTVNPAMIEA